MKFSDLLHPPGDKVSLGEMAEIRKLLPERVTKTIPSCMYTDTKRFDYEVVIILAWIIARRENKDITREEVGNQIGLKEAGHFDVIEKEIHYFYSRRTRDEIEKEFAEADEKIKEAKERLRKIAEGELDSADEVSDSLEDEDPGNPQTVLQESQ
jgi:hypothetical protein